MERYWVKVDSAGKPIRLFRLVDDPPIFAEETWETDKWEETDRLVKYLLDLESSLEEITLDEAKAFIAQDAAAPNA